MIKYTNQTQKAKSLATRIQKNLSECGFKDRGVKKSNFHVLRETRSPAVLIELGFIDNTKDNELFDSNSNETYYRVMAVSFKDSIYFKPNNSILILFNV